MIHCDENTRTTTDVGEPIVPQVYPLHNRCIAEPLSTIDRLLQMYDVASSFSRDTEIVLRVDRRWITLELCADGYMCCEQLSNYLPQPADSIEQMFKRAIRAFQVHNRKIEEIDKNGIKGQHAPCYYATDRNR